MPEITREQMMEWLKEQPLGTKQDLKMSNAIIRLLKKKKAAPTKGKPVREENSGWKNSRKGWDKIPNAPWAKEPGND